MAPNYQNIRMGFQYFWISTAPIPTLSLLPFCKIGKFSSSDSAVVSSCHGLRVLLRLQGKTPRTMKGTYHLTSASQHDLYWPVLTLERPGDLDANTGQALINPMLFPIVIMSFSKVVENISRFYSVGMFQCTKLIIKLKGEDLATSLDLVKCIRSDVANGTICEIKEASIVVSSINCMWSIKVAVSGTCLNMLLLNTGIPQGCFLSPILFFIHIIDLLHVATSLSRGYKYWGSRRFFIQQHQMNKPINPCSVKSIVANPSANTAIVQKPLDWGQHAPRLR